jgi:hypothetical protein
MMSKKTSSKNIRCEHPHCECVATRKVKVSGTGGWAEEHFFCKQHADEIEKN